MVVRPPVSCKRQLCDCVNSIVSSLLYMGATGFEQFKMTARTICVKLMDSTVRILWLHSAGLLFFNLLLRGAPPQQCTRER